MVRSHFRFLNYGGTYQLSLENAGDLGAIPELDEVFWMATSAPVHQLRCDPRLIQLLDADRNQRILSSNIRDALDRITRLLTCLDGVSDASDVLNIDHIIASNDEGRRLLMTAERILRNLNKADARSISLADVRSHQEILSKGIYNGDGVIPVEQITDKKVRAFADDIILAIGGIKDANGQTGINREKLDTFIKCANDLISWSQKCALRDDKTAGLLPLNEATADAHRLLCRLRDPINQFFRACELMALNLAYDTPGLKPVTPGNLLFDRQEIESYLKKFPVAVPNRDCILDLDSELNPWYRDDLHLFRDKILIPLMGNAFNSRTFSKSDWSRTIDAFSMYEKWLAEKPASDVEKLGEEKLRQFLQGPYADKLIRLIDEDQKIAKELSAADDLEFLILLQRWFLELCNNFVSFRNLYNPEHRAMFEEGRLILSGRVFNLNIRVQDPETHGLIAVKSGIFLIYSEITGTTGSQKFYVVTPVTNMTAGRVCVNLRGVFFDLDGREWDARIVKIVENPICLREAVLKPFVRIADAISKSLEKVISGTEKHLETHLTKTAGAVETEIKAGMEKPVVDASTGAGVKSEPARSRELIVSGSVAVAALGSSFAFIAKTLAAVNPKHVLFIIIFGIFVILIPTFIIAWLRLRKRNLGGLLEASGWAMNAEMRLTRRLARIFSPEPTHPAGFTWQRYDLTKLFERRKRDNR